MPIRPYRHADLPTLAAINAEGVPNVSAESEDSLGVLIGMGMCLVVTDMEDVPLGFVNLIEPGTMEYPSDNLRWFERWLIEEKQPDLLYVDRIAMAGSARSKGLGQSLYDAASELARGRSWLGCEVNEDPPNPRSMRFHERLGFLHVGGHRYRPGYAVRFYARPV